MVSYDSGETSEKELNIEKYQEGIRIILSAALAIWHHMIGW
jgi:hypothetical protein